MDPINGIVLQKNKFGGFPVGPVAKTACPNTGGSRFDPLVSEPDPMYFNPSMLHAAAGRPGIAK